MNDIQNRCCGNCRHRIAIDEDKELYCCEIKKYRHLGYLDSLEYWCRKWARMDLEGKDGAKTQTAGNAGAL